MEEFGKTVVKELKPGGQDILVTEANKREYVQRACNMKMRESIKGQIDSCSQSNGASVSLQYK